MSNLQPGTSQHTAFLAEWKGQKEDVEKSHSFFDSSVRWYAGKFMESTHAKSQENYKPVLKEIETNFNKMMEEHIEEVERMVWRLLNTLEKSEETIFYLPVVLPMAPRRITSL